MRVCCLCGHTEKKTKNTCTLRHLSPVPCIQRLGPRLAPHSSSPVRLHPLGSIAFHFQQRFSPSSGLADDFQDRSECRCAPESAAQDTRAEGCNSIQGRAHNAQAMPTKLHAAMVSRFEEEDILDHVCIRTVWSSNVIKVPISFHMSRSGNLFTEAAELSKTVLGSLRILFCLLLQSR